MKSNKELDSILDKATSEIRNEAIEATAVAKAGERVWARLSSEATATLPIATTPVEHIESCRDFQSLIPAYLSGSLSEARELLLVDHTHECIPCRRALKDARTRGAVTSKPAVQKKRFSIQPVVLRWGIAAALVIGFGLLAIPLLQRYAPFGNFDATVQAAEGQVYQVADTKSIPVIVGEKLTKGETIRTAKDAHLFVRLGDGSVIEVSDRSQFSLTKNGLGTTIHLNHGNIIVQAAKQGNQHLFVDTGDSNIAVTGTVFSVNHGTKGARVSVIEGNVELDHGGRKSNLRAGEQATTSASLEKVAIKDEVSWSKNAARYAESLSALTALNGELNKVARPGVRNSTRLLDLMPENTVFYAALPNLAATLTESQRIMQQRIDQNPALRAWVEKERSHHGPNMDQMIGTIREFGDYLGDELAISVSMDEKGEPVSPVILAELKNSAGFRQFLEQQLAKYDPNATDKPKIHFVDDPLTASASTDQAKQDKELFVWIQKDLLVASPKLPELQALAARMQQGKGAFAGTPFYARIADVYREGAGLVVAANLDQVLAQTKTQRAKGPNAEKQESALQQLGVLNMKYFVLDQKEGEGKTHTRAVLSFSESQKGIPSWLDAPRAMGSLAYVSPDANVVFAFAVKKPVAMVDDLLEVLDTVSPGLRKNVDQIQTEHGLDLRRDIAAPLGGEFAFALDGPIIPTPAWKMVFEVSDSAHLQQTLEHVVVEINKEAAKHGKGNLVWDRGELSGRTYYTLKSADFGLVELNYTYANGYLIAGPSRAMVANSLAIRDSGSTLLSSSRFTAGLPADGNTNFSAVFYHNLAPLMQPFADRIAASAKDLPQDHQQAIKQMAASLPPTLAYAYAQGDSITFAANTEGGPFGLGPTTLLGMPNALSMQHLLMQGMHGSK